MSRGLPAENICRGRNQMSALEFIFQNADTVATEVLAIGPDAINHFSKHPRRLWMQWHQDIPVIVTVAIDGKFGLVAIILERH